MDKAFIPVTMMKKCLKFYKNFTKSFRKKCFRGRRGFTVIDSLKSLISKHLTVICRTWQARKCNG